MKTIFNFQFQILKKNARKNAGFTIIEMMIAVALFVVVVTLGIGAALNATDLHNKTKALRALEDNLSFIMEDMSRNIRLGTNYHCFDSTEAVAPIPSIQNPKNCPNNSGVLALESFEGNPLDANDQIIYAITGAGNLEKSKNGGVVFTNLNSTNDNEKITFDILKSGFTVIGAPNKSESDFEEPRVIIRLSGNIEYKDANYPFNIETTVSARATDN